MNKTDLQLAVSDVWQDLHMLEWTSIDNQLNLAFVLPLWVFLTWKGVEYSSISQAADKYFFLISYNLSNVIHIWKNCISSFLVSTLPFLIYQTQF